MKITIEVVGSVFRVEIDNQPETATEQRANVLPQHEAGDGRATVRNAGVTAGETALNSDGGLNIVTKHTEIQANPEETGTDGETATVPVVDAGSRPVAGRSATATSEDGRDSLERQAPKISVLRPHCKHKDACGGYGFNHCYGCLRGVNAEGSAA